jgi:hypothetical protein
LSEQKETLGWCVMELMGHVRLGGFVREVTLAGHGFLRLDIPGDKPDEVYATQYVPPASLYRLTPCSEDAALAAARGNRPEPVERWELPRLAGPSRDDEVDYDQLHDGDHDDPTTPSGAG